MRQYAVLKNVVRGVNFGVVVKSHGNLKFYGWSEKGIEWSRWANDNKADLTQLPANIAVGEFKGLSDEMMKSIILDANESVAAGESVAEKKILAFNLGSERFANTSKYPSFVDAPIYEGWASKTKSINFKAKNFRKEVAHNEISLRVRMHELAFDNLRKEFVAKPNKATKTYVRSEIRKKMSRGAERKFGQRIVGYVNASVEEAAGLPSIKRAQLGSNTKEILSEYTKASLGRTIGRAVGSAARGMTPNRGRGRARGAASRFVSGVLDPRKRRDVDGDGMIFDGTWREMPDPSRFVDRLTPNRYARRQRQQSTERISRVMNPEGSGMIMEGTPPLSPVGRRRLTEGRSAGLRSGRGLNTEGPVNQYGGGQDTDLGRMINERSRRMRETPGFKPSGPMADSRRANRRALDSGKAFEEFGNPQRLSDEALESAIAAMNLGGRDTAGKMAPYLKERNNRKAKFGKKYPRQGGESSKPNQTLRSSGRKYENVSGPNRDRLENMRDTLVSGELNNPKQLRDQLDKMNSDADRISKRRLANIDELRELPQTPENKRKRANLLDEIIRDGQEVEYLSAASEMLSEHIDNVAAGRDVRSLGGDRNKPRALRSSTLNNIIDSAEGANENLLVDALRKHQDGKPLSKEEKDYLLESLRNILDNNPDITEDERVELIDLENAISGRNRTTGLRSSTLSKLADSAEGANEDELVDALRKIQRGEPVTGEQRDYLLESLRNILDNNPDITEDERVELIDLENKIRRQPGSGRTLRSSSPRSLRSSGANRTQGGEIGKAKLETNTDRDDFMNNVVLLEEPNRSVRANDPTKVAWNNGLEEAIDEIGGGEVREVHVGEGITAGNIIDAEFPGADAYYIVEGKDGRFKIVKGSNSQTPPKDGYGAPIDNPRFDTDFGDYDTIEEARERIQSPELAASLDDLRENERLDDAYARDLEEQFGEMRRGRTLRSSGQGKPKTQEDVVRRMRGEFNSAQEELDQINMLLEADERAPIGSQSMTNEIARSYQAQREMMQKRKRYLERLIERGGAYDRDKGPGRKPEKNPFDPFELERFDIGELLKQSEREKFPKSRGRTGRDQQTQRLIDLLNQEDQRPKDGRIGYNPLPDLERQRERDEEIRRILMGTAGDFYQAAQAQRGGRRSGTLRSSGNLDGIREMSEGAGEMDFVDAINKIRDGKIDEISDDQMEYLRETVRNILRNNPDITEDERVALLDLENQIRPNRSTLRSGARGRPTQQQLSSRRMLATTERAARPRGTSLRSSGGTGGDRTPAPKAGSGRGPGVGPGGKYGHGAMERKYGREKTGTDGELWDSLTPEQKKAVEEALLAERKTLEKKLKGFFNKYWAAATKKGAKKQGVVAAYKRGRGKAGGRYEKRPDDDALDATDVSEMLLRLDQAVANGDIEKFDADKNTRDLKLQPDGSATISNVKSGYKDRQQAIDDMQTVLNMIEDGDFSALEHLHPTIKKKIAKVIRDKGGEVPKGWEKELSTVARYAGGEERRKAPDAIDMVKERGISEKKKDKRLSLFQRLRRMDPERERQIELRAARRAGGIREGIALDPEQSIKKRKLRARAMKRRMISRFKKSRNPDDLASDSKARKDAAGVVKTDPATNKVEISDGFVDLMHALDNDLIGIQQKKRKGATERDTENEHKTLLKRVWENAGYAETPTTLTDDEVKSLVKAGWQVIVRGTGHEKVDSESYVERFLHEEGRFIPGQGGSAYGIGEYFAYPGEWTGYHGSGPDDRHTIVALIPPTADVMTASEISREHRRMGELTGRINDRFKVLGGRDAVKARTPEELVAEIDAAVPDLASDTTRSGQIVKQLRDRLEALSKMPNDTPEQKAKIAETKEKLLSTLDYLERYTKQRSAEMIAPIIGVDVIDTNNGESTGSPMLVHNRTILAAFQNPATLQQAEAMVADENGKQPGKVWTKWKRTPTDGDTKPRRLTRRRTKPATQPAPQQPAPQPANQPTPPAPASSVPNTPGGPVNTDTWNTSTPPTTGSNPAMMLTAPDGTRYYTKLRKSGETAQQAEERMQTEVLASKLYALAGVPVADLQMGTNNGDPVMMSRMIQVRMPRGKADNDAARDNFVVDAWLANWDAPLNDNIQIDSNGNAVRMDVGGSLDFRAQGQRKGSGRTVAFGNNPGEMNSMQKQGTYDFTGMDAAELKKQAQRLSTITNDDIRKTVAAVVTDPARAAQLAATLIARRDAIVQGWG